MLLQIDSATTLPLLSFHASALLLEKVNPAREEENRERLLCNLPGSAGQTGNLFNLLLFQAREITTLP